MKIITPYVSETEIVAHKKMFWEYDIYYEQDEAGIGSDLMFQRMWNKFPNEDIFILHADMYIYENNWLDNLLAYVGKYPEAGMFGCLLLYPAKSVNSNYYIQSAGGKFTNGNPDHFGSGLIVETGDTFKTHLEEDLGQHDSVREVAWTTFGGCYIRRDLIKSVGNFSSEYTWTYNRDVDYCLKARDLGYKIYQVPVRLLHAESKDNKRIKAVDPLKVQAEARNLNILKNKWSGSPLYETIDNKIN